MSELIPRRTLRPGLKGYSPEPTDPLEAKDILNLEMDREGIWKPRPGLSTLATFGATINHLSRRPLGYSDSYPFAVCEGGNLRVVSLTGTSPAVKDTGWPTQYGVRHCWGVVSGNNYWIAPKAHVNGQASPYRINNAGGFAVLAGSPPSNLNWVESYGRYIVGIAPSSIYWSDADNADAWTGSSNVSVLPNLNRIYGFVALSEQQAIIIADTGTGIWTGNEESVFQQGELFNLWVIATALTAIRCGGRVMFLGPGPRIYSFSPSLERIDSPINKELQSTTDTGNVMSWFDPVRNWYCIADYDQDETWCYDFERNVWACRWDKALVGIGVQEQAQAPFARRFFGYGTKFTEMVSSSYQDDGTAMTVAIETTPDDGGNPSLLKCMSQVYVDGTGTWTVAVKGRSNPSAAFTTVTSTTVAAPGWAYLDYHQYTEASIRLSATLTSTTSHSFKQLQLDERILGVKY